MIRRIKACLNGGRRADDHPAVPITPDQLAGAAAAAVAAGAEALHLHPRDGGGAESLRAEHIGTAVAAVRDLCPHTPIGVSTGLWMTGGDADRRQREVDRWAALPPGSAPTSRPSTSARTASPRSRPRCATPGSSSRPVSGPWMTPTRWPAYRWGGS